MSEDESDWTEQERALLDALEPSAAPPPALEARVVAALREHGLVRARRPRIPWTAAAAAVAALFAGVWLGRVTAVRTAPPLAPQARTFMLLLYPGAGQDPSPRAEQERVLEYGLWARGLRAEGRLVAGEKLKPALSLAGGDSPGANAGDLQGFFMIRAGTLEEAERIARSCPHRGHGGTVALREVDPT